jgi:hypothetical protein
VIQIKYWCDGCNKTENVMVYRETVPLTKSLDRFRVEGGLCKYRWPIVDEKLPEGWGICGLGCVYCPKCFSEVNSSQADDKGDDK